MANLRRASRELFSRPPDECFDSLDVLAEHCRKQKEDSMDRWHPPRAMQFGGGSGLQMTLGQDGAFALNDWSFSQLCSLARVSKDTVNRLSPDTASQVSGDHARRQQAAASAHGGGADSVHPRDAVRASVEPGPRPTGQGTRDRFLAAAERIQRRHRPLRRRRCSTALLGNGRGCIDLSPTTFASLSLCLSGIAFRSVNLAEFGGISGRRVKPLRPGVV